MTPRQVRAASRVIAAADAAIVALGVLALLLPGQLIPAMSTTRLQLACANAHLAGHRSLHPRCLLPGCALNVAVGLPLSVITLTAFRARQRWAWWTLLTANAIALLRAARMGPAGGAAAGP